MADIKRKIDIEVDTGAAQNAIGALADTMAGLTKASDDSGDAMKKASRATAEATAAQNAAREASQKATRALNEARAAAEAHGKESREAAEATARLKAAQDDAAKAHSEAAKAAEKAAKEVDELAKTADKKAVAGLKRLANELVKVGKEADKNAGDLRTLEHRITSLGGAAGKSGGMLASFKGNLAAMAAGALSGKLKDLGLHALETAASFESMKAALASTLGSQEAANEKFAELQTFAAATPYGLEETTKAFLKLSNYGLDASTKAMTAYGNMAGALGKSMEDIVEAVADAVQGEGERLKELGIKMNKDGDRVRLTFRGMTEEMKFDAREIESYLIQLAETNFAGGMEAQSKTLGGLWSQMKDGFDQFLVSIMDSGITDALKSIMGSFAGMGETGKLLSDILGVALGGAMHVLAAATQIVTVTLEAFSWTVNTLLSPIGWAKDGLVALADSMKETEEEARAVAEAQAELDRQYWESAKGTGTLAADIQGLINLSGEYASSILAEAQAHLDAAGAADRRAKAEADLYEQLAKRWAKDEDKALLDQFEKDNMVGPQLPPGFKRKDKKKGKKKDPAMEAIKKFSFLGASADRDPLGAMWSEEAAAAYEAESAAREARLAGISREIEALEARGIAEAEQVDAVFFMLEVESEAAAQREALIDQRLAKEEQLARWQVRNAKTQAEREKAQTRLEAAEHAKRVRGLEKIAKDEAKEHSKRQKIVETLTGAVTALGEGMVDALQRAAEGEKGALASMLAELLKGVAKKHAILAFGEIAQGAGAQAATWGIPNPKSIAHYTAAGLHIGVAAAAGVGAMVAGAVADSRQSSSGGGGRGSSFGTSGGSSGALPSGGSSGSGGSLERPDVPTSYEDTRRRDTGRGAMVGPAPLIVNINAGVIGEGGGRKIAQDIERLRYNNRGAGQRV